MTVSVISDIFIFVLVFVRVCVHVCSFLNTLESAHALEYARVGGAGLQTPYIIAYFNYRSIASGYL